MGLTLQRFAGAAIALLTVLPLYQLIRVDRSGPWGESTVAEAARGFDVSLWGSVLVIGVAVVVGIWSRRRAKGGADSVEPNSREADAGSDTTDDTGGPEALRGAAAFVARLPIVPFAIACGVVATSLAALIAHRVFLRLLTNVDEMTSIIHARYLAAGMWGGPVEGAAEAWLLPNMLVVDKGWISQYPPGHLLLMAAFERLGAPWLLGPVLLGLMVTFACLATHRLLHSRPIEVRVGALLLTLSPFLLLLGGGALSHLSAGSALAAAAYFGVRARDGRALWALVAGVATGVAVVCRPWTGLALAPVLTVGPWLYQAILARREAERRRGDRALVARVAWWILGGLPFAVLIAWTNLQLFGNPLQLGYEVLYGPAHQLGFHLDPWGYPYGLREAIAYTSADLVRFGVALLDTPVPLTLVVAATLLFGRRLPPGARVLALWALVPVAANALYWFHQPRMLFEAAPGWIYLAVVGVGLALRSAKPGVRAATLTAVAVSLAVGAWAFVPLRFAGHSWSDETLARITPPAVEGDAPALVFVHASWHERVAGRFQAAGMRNDSLQAVVRRNDMCAIDRYARVRNNESVAGYGSALDATVDETQTSELRAGLSPVATPGGVRVPRLEGAEWTPACERELAADRFGAVSLAPLIWQGALPGLDETDAHPSRQSMFVRDYGPERNRALLDRFPQRQAWVFTATGPDSAPRLVPYEEGMRVLWGAAGSAPAPPSEVPGA